MERKEDILQRQNRMLHYVNSLPLRILQSKNIDNPTAFVLHDLCNENCLNLSKAAFFVDNPDFNCTKGVAGFCREEAFKGCDLIWSKPKEFVDHMHNAKFNTQVRSMTKCSLKKSDNNDQELAKTLAKDLGFKNYAFCSWDMRHDNHGFVVYERSNDCDVATQEAILNGLSILGFCPIF